MKSKLIACIVLLMSAATTFAQSELPNDSIKRVFRSAAGAGNPLAPEKQSLKTNDDLPDTADSAPSYEKVDLKIVPPIYVNNQWIVPQPGTYFNPFVWDYSRSDSYPIFENTDINTYSLHQTLISMGTLKQIGVNYVYTPNEHWVLTGGVYAAQYSIPAVHPMDGMMYDAGINGSATYWFNEHVYLSLYGQYSFNNQRNSRKGYMTPGMFPQSMIGGSIGVMFNEHFGVEGGANYEFNPMKRKWEAHPTFGPVIHFKKKK